MTGGEFSRDYGDDLTGQIDGGEQPHGEDPKVLEDHGALVEQMRAGEYTTDDKLRGQLFEWRGEEALSNKGLHRFYKLVNETVNGRAGEPFVMVLSHTRYSEPQGCPGVGRVIDGFNYTVYGILTGEPLRFQGEEQGFVIPSEGWLRTSDTANRAASSHSHLSIGGPLVQHIDSQLEQSGSDAVPLLPFEVNSIVDKASPSFQIVVGTEQVDEALRERPHTSWYDSYFAASIAELHRQLDPELPIPETCKVDLIMGEMKIIRDDQRRQENLEKLRGEFDDAKAALESIGEKIEQLEQQGEEDDERRRQLAELREFFGVPLDRQSE